MMKALIFSNGGSTLHAWINADKVAYVAETSERMKSGEEVETLEVYFVEGGEPLVVVDRGRELAVQFSQEWVYWNQIASKN